MISMIFSRFHGVELASGKMGANKRGEFLFYDSGYCFQNWQSCASCHTDGRVDGFNWDLPKDGLGTPRNTKSVLYSAATAPTTITGDRKNAHESILSAVQFSEAELSQSDLDAIYSYIRDLKSVPSPYLVEGKFSALALRGRQIFNDSGCVDCHSGKYYTNQKLKSVGTGLGKEKKNMKYDVPTLREVWRTGPYLHDGRAVSIVEIFSKFNKENDHGDTRDLTAEQLEALAAYVLSL